MATTSTSRFRHSGKKGTYMQDRERVKFCKQSQCGGDNAQVHPVQCKVSVEVEGTS